MPPAALTTLTRRAFAVVALVGTLTLGSALAVQAQEIPPSTTAGVLIPGTTAPTQTVAPSSTTTTEAPADSDNGLLDLDANEKVWVIVAGLVAVAALMLILTVLYWRHTKPERSPQDKRITKAEKKNEKKRRKAASKHPFLDDDVAEAAAPAPAESPAPTPKRPADGPMDLDDLLGTPDPSRSVFGSPGEDPEPDR